jgi:hypothetical protein
VAKLWSGGRLIGYTHNDDGDLMLLPDGGVVLRSPSCSAVALVVGVQEQRVTVE